MSARAYIAADFDGYLITPTGLPYGQMIPEDIVAMTMQGEAHGHQAAVVGVAVPSRHLPLAPAIRRDRPYARAVRDDARVHESRDTTVPLHGRHRRRARHPLRALRDVRHPGALRSRARARLPTGAHACLPTTA